MIKSIYTKKLDLDLPSIKTYCENWFDNHSSRSVSNRGGLQSDVLSGSHTPLNDLFLEIEKQLICSFWDKFRKIQKIF